MKLKALALLPVLAGCASMAPETDDKFRAALSAEYDALYRKELALTDWNDWPRFRALRDAAAAGEPVRLIDLDMRALPADQRAALEAARARLAPLFDSPAEAVAGAAFAGAVGAFECWAEEAEEGLEPDQRDACRARFEELIGAAEEGAKAPFTVLLPAENGGGIDVLADGAVAAIDEPFTGAVRLQGGVAREALDPAAVKRVLSRALAVEPAKPRSYLIYFESGGSTITEDSAAALEAALTDAGATENARVLVLGHTDTVGGAAGNARIARRRADAMRNRLIEAGLAAEAVKARGMGENDLLVPTPDNTAEAKNRRVEIVVQ